MRLLDLEPRWLNSGGKNVAIMFQCPHCHAAGKRQWITCFFVKAGSIPRDADGDPGDRAMFARAFIDMGLEEEAAGNQAWGVVGCNPERAWTRSGHDFATMSVTPSIDGSASGHWHGHITSGQIVGGI